MNSRRNFGLAVERNATINSKDNNQLWLILNQITIFDEMRGDGDGSRTATAERERNDDDAQMKRQCIDIFVLSLSLGQWQRHLLGFKSKTLPFGIEWIFLSE